MNGKDMLEWMNDLDDKAVVDADVTPVRVKKHNVWKIGLSVAAGVLVLALLSYVLYPYITGRKNNKPDTSISDDTIVSETQILKSYVMASPGYPEIPENPNLSEEWDKEKAEEYRQVVNELRNQPEGYLDGYDAYLKDVLGVVLSDTGNENVAFSPLCLYMTLGMTAEITDGNTRQQILDVLHQPDVATLRTRAKSIWLANYMDDGLSKLLLANSLWMKSDWIYEQSVLDILASDYFASSYSGDPTQAEYSQAFRYWVNEQTDGLLGDMIDGLELDPELVIALVSSVNYSGKWVQPFQDSMNRTGAFYAPSGEVSCEYMCTDKAYENYYGDHFECVALPILENGSVRFILPEEGKTPEELLMDEEFLQFLNTNRYEWEKSREYYGIHLEVPKFDISSDLKLNDSLKALGIANLFDAGSADFNPLVGKSDSVHVNSIEQKTRVMIDEEGCKAVSATILIAVDGEIQEDYELVLDRPFVFEILSETGTPLFVGIVNNPSQS